MLPASTSLSMDRLTQVWGDDANEWNPQRFMLDSKTQKTTLGVYANLWVCFVEYVMVFWSICSVWLSVSSYWQWEYLLFWWDLKRCRGKSLHRVECYTYTCCLPLTWLFLLDGSLREYISYTTKLQQLNAFHTFSIMELQVTLVLSKLSWIPADSLGIRQFSLVYLRTLNLVLHLKVWTTSSVYRVLNILSWVIHHI